MRRPALRRPSRMPRRRKSHRPRNPIQSKRPKKPGKRCRQRPNPPTSSRRQKKPLLWVTRARYLRPRIVARTWRARDRHVILEADMRAATMDRYITATEAIGSIADATVIA